MTLTLPSPLDEELSPASAALHLAIGLCVGKKASLGRAASVAGLAIGDFMQELCERRIPLNYGPEDLQHDLKVIDELMRQ